MFEVPSSVPPSPNVAQLAPMEIARQGAMTGVEAAQAGVGGVMNLVGAAVPLVGVGFMAWWGADMILGGMLSHPLTPKSARHMA